jgi:hypothetical protein
MSIDTSIASIRCSFRIVFRKRIPNAIAAFDTCSKGPQHNLATIDAVAHAKTEHGGSAGGSP